MGSHSYSSLFCIIEYSVVTTMGHGASCTPTDRYDEYIQMPSTSSRKQLCVTSSDPQSRNKSDTSHQLSSAVSPERFQVKNNTDQYNSIWDVNTKVGL